MDFRDAYQSAAELRKLLRRADRFGYSLDKLKQEILFLAEAKETYAEYHELKMISEFQKEQAEVA